MACALRRRDLYAATRPSELSGAIARALHDSPRRASRRHAGASLRLATALLLTCTMTAPGWAAEWTGAISSDWFDAGNWLGGSVPALGEEVVIDTTTPNPTVIGGGGSADVGTIDVGVDATGSLRIEGSALVVSSGGPQSRIGALTGSNGTVTVTGAGTQWLLDHALIVGREGAGALMVSGGASVSSDLGVVGDLAGAQGAATITGANSSWVTGGFLFVGNFGQGTMTIADGGRVANATSGSLGGGADAVGIVTVTGFDSRWDVGGFLTVANLGTATLAIDAGGIVTSDAATLGLSAGGIGEVTVAGTGSAWSQSGNLFIGQAGTGTMDISAGGAVATNNQGILGYAAGAEGRVTATGPGSIWILGNSLQVGREGIGELTIAAGGRVLLDPGIGAAYLGLGARPGSSGTMTVTGTGSAWNGRDGVMVGDAGTGTLTIENGGVVSDSLGILANSVGGMGTATVRGIGSQWNSTGFLSVGRIGSGELTIEAGGSVASAAGELGAAVGSQGTVAVTGPGSTWDSGDALVVGDFGSGELTVSDGGAVHAALGVEIARSAGATGTLNIGAGEGEVAIAAGLVDTPSITFGAGTGTLNFNHTDDGYMFAAAIGGSGTLNQLAGTTILTGAGDAGGMTNVRGGTLLVEGSLGDTTTTVFDGATLGGSGAIAGDVTVQDGGILAPGSSAGTLTVGSLNLGLGSVLDYELGQAGVIGSGVNDLIEINGDLTLDGLLDVTDIGGFGVGVYRLMNYGGELTDHGLDLRTLPTGFDAQDLFVQTAIEGEVNLVNSAGLSLSFWDGSVATQHNNGAIDGGDGTWDAANDNWTAADGAVNGRWDAGTFAVFGGAGGDVTVVGEQAVAGMQFMSGYALTAGTGGALRFDGADSVIRVDPDVTATIAAPIVGAGGLVKTDTGTLVLSGENTYGGGTRIDRGTLQVSRNANLGDAAGALVFDGGTLHNTEGFITRRNVTLEQGGGTFRTDMPLTVVGTISGEGRLTKTGVDTLILSVANDYTGGTWILDGHITARVTGALGTGPVQIDDGTLLFVAQARADGLTIGNAGGELLFIEGSSAGDAVIDSASGLVAFHHSSTADGASIANGAASTVDISGLGGDGISIGSLSGAGRVLLGDKTLSIGGLGRNDVMAGVISGEGALIKQGAGTLTLTAANTFTGGVSILTGTLRLGDGGTTGSVDGDVAIGGGGMLVFDRSDSFTFEGVFSGDGGMQKLGSGELELTGDSSAFAGTSTIDAGVLRVDGALGGLTRIEAEATLLGTGTLGDVDNAGTLAPGGSIGTLSLTGDYLHRAGATFLAEIEPGGAGDLLDVAGTATLEGGTVDVDRAPGQYARGTRYTLIDAAGGLTGTFSALTQDLPFLELALSYDANHAYLDVLRNDTTFASVCRTYNHCQVAVTVDRISGGDQPPSDDLITVIEELTTLDVDAALDGFDRLSGEAHASFAGAMLEGHALYGQTVARRIADRREAEGADRLHGGTWVRGYGASSDLDGDGNAHGADLEVYGTAAGVDAWATESWLVGASLNALKLDADFRPGDGGEADAKNIALYASVQGERAYFDAVASYAWWDAEVTRRIEVGSIARTARSDYGMHRFATYLEAGMNFDLGGGTLQPLLGAEWSLLSSEGFRETGADDVDLIGSAQNVERTVASAGLRWSREFGGGEWTWAPTAQARWLHTFGDLDAEFDVAFAGAPDVGYRVRGVTGPEDRGLLGIGLQARRDNLDLFLDLDYQAGDGFKAASMGGGLRWRW